VYRLSLEGPVGAGLPEAIQFITKAALANQAFEEPLRRMLQLWQRNVEEAMKERFPGVVGGFAPEHFFAAFFDGIGYRFAGDKVECGAIDSDTGGGAA